MLPGTAVLPADTSTLYTNSPGTAMMLQGRGPSLVAGDAAAGHAHAIARAHGASGVGEPREKISRAMISRWIWDVPS